MRTTIVHRSSCWVRAVSTSTGHICEHQDSYTLEPMNESSPEAFFLLQSRWQSTVGITKCMMPTQVGSAMATPNPTGMHIGGSCLP